MGLTLKLLLRCKVSSASRRQGVGPGQETSSATEGSGGETVNQAGVMQEMDQTGSTRRLDLSRALTLSLILF